MRILASLLLALTVLVVLAVPVCAQEVQQFSDVKAGPRGHLLELTIGRNGKVESAQLQIFNGSTKPVVDLSMKVRAAGTRIVLEGNDRERGDFVIVGFRHKEYVNGTIQENGGSEQQIRLYRK